jgi:hypothetical protein
MGEQSMIEPEDAEAEEDANAEADAEAETAADVFVSRE